MLIASPEGIEPPSKAPEALILSVELRRQIKVIITGVMEKIEGAGAYAGSQNI